MYRLSKTGSRTNATGLCLRWRFQVGKQIQQAQQFPFTPLIGTRHLSTAILFHDDLWHYDRDTLRKMQMDLDADEYIIRIKQQTAQVNKTSMAIEDRVWDMAGAEEDSETLEQPQPGEVDPETHGHKQSNLDANNDSMPQKCDRTTTSGMMTMTEFDDALQDLKYEDIKGLHKSIHKILVSQANAFEKKMERILNIEDQLLQLIETSCGHAKEKGCDNNFVMSTTDSDIDSPFVWSSLEQSFIRQSVEELKSLVEEAKTTYSQSWEMDL
jgi:hypothetical protein